jgi:hypothetical protein
MSDEFRAFIHTGDEGRVVFQQAMAHARAMVDNGERVLVVVGPALEPISIRQRRFLHGPALGQISEQARVNGERYTVDTWKEFYRRMFLGTNGARYEMQRLPGAKRATPRRVPVSTETLGIRAYATFIDQIIAHAATELNVHFHFEQGEREATRPTRRQRQEETATHDDRSAAG